MTKNEQIDAIFNAALGYGFSALLLVLTVWVAYSMLGGK